MRSVTIRGNRREILVLMEWFFVLVGQWSHELTHVVKGCPAATPILPMSVFKI